MDEISAISDKVEVTETCNEQQLGDFGNNEINECLRSF